MFWRRRSVEDQIRAKAAGMESKEIHMGEFAHKLYRSLRDEDGWELEGGMAEVLKKQGKGKDPSVSVFLETSLRLYVRLHITAYAHDVAEALTDDEQGLIKMAYYERRRKEKEKLLQRVKL